mgnify:FL=1|tara:strand:- start:121 stop:438 length:318 start_codon:yes stop_codon:yes gene_type:complete
MTDIDTTQFEEAKTQFTLLLPEIDEKKAELKALKKVHNVYKHTIYSYMRENEIDELDVGGYYFTIKQKQKFSVKEDDLIDLLDEDVLNQFRTSKESLGVKKRRRV